jgi:uncharacterized membrane protein YkgB
MMEFFVRTLIRFGLLKEDFDYYLIRGALIFIFLIFGYQKWFEYEAHAVIPFIRHGPLTFWLYLVFGGRGATIFLGVSEWIFAALLFLGFWSHRLGVLGSAGASLTFVATVTTIPFLPDAWAPAAGGFPAMTLPMAFLIKDVVLLAASLYLLKQDVTRLTASSTESERPVRVIAGHST